MAIQLMKLRGVPEDELAELYHLLDEHNIAYYETSAGNWGISMPALWLSDVDQLELALELLEKYQYERYQQARRAYEEQKASGTARTLPDIFRDNPWRFILYMAIVGGLIYVSVVPWWKLTS